MASPPSPEPAEPGVAPAVATLPKGRHGLTRQQVADTQRLRLAVAMAESLADGGYVGTPVAAVLKRAGVSRETFYQLYDGKLDCFLDALDLAGEVLLAELAEVIDGPGTSLTKAGRAVERYLSAIGDQPAFARLYLVEVHAAGPVAMARRAELQSRIVDAMATLLGAGSDGARFACQLYVAAIGSLVTVPIVTGDHQAIADLKAPLLRQLETMARAF